MEFSIQANLFYDFSLHHSDAATHIVISRSSQDGDQPPEDRCLDSVEKGIDPWMSPSHDHVIPALLELIQQSQDLKWLDLEIRRKRKDHRPPATFQADCQRGGFPEPSI